MKIAIVGTKGIPAKYGGFETFAFHLAKHLSMASHEVTIVNEKDNHAAQFDFPVNICYSTNKKSEHPLLFYKQSLKLVCKSNDIILVCGVGGTMFYPLAKGKALLVTNVDGLEHLRGKYTFLQRKFVFVLQKLAALFSDHLVADSAEVKKYWLRRFPGKEKKISDIAYGAEEPVVFDDSILKKIGVSSGDYYLVVARLVPENNLQLILDGFAKYKGNKKLVIVGNTNDNPFSITISKNGNDRIKFIGAIYDKPLLDSLRKNCFAYLHGHSVGGTNPALLEAMICKCVCICHDNVFNREVSGNDQLYFNTSSKLSERIFDLEKDSLMKERLSVSAYQRVVSNYSWSKIAERYSQMFSDLMKGKVE